MSQWMSADVCKRFCMTKEQLLQGRDVHFSFFCFFLDSHLWDIRLQIGIQTGSKVMEIFFQCSLTYYHTLSKVV